MKKIITAVCLTVLVLTSCQQAKQKVFEIASQEVNKQCPMTIDEMTRMDSTSYTGGDNTFTYYYTLSSRRSEHSGNHSKTFGGKSTGNHQKHR